jgi:hypothetical protein
LLSRHEPFEPSEASIHIGEKGEALLHLFRQGLAQLVDVCCTAFSSKSKALATSSKMPM